MSDLTNATAAVVALAEKAERIVDRRIAEEAALFNPASPAETGLVSVPGADVSNSTVSVPKNAALALLMRQYAAQGFSLSGGGSGSAPQFSGFGTSASVVPGQQLPLAGLTVTGATSLTLMTAGGCVVRHVTDTPVYGVGGTIPLADIGNIEIVGGTTLGAFDLTIRADGAGGLQSFFTVAVTVAAAVPNLAINGEPVQRFASSGPTATALQLPISVSGGVAPYTITYALTKSAPCNFEERDGAVSALTAAGTLTASQLTNLYVTRTSSLAGAPPVNLNHADITDIQFRRKVAGVWGGWIVASVATFIANNQLDVSGGGAADEYDILIACGAARNITSISNWMAVLGYAAPGQPDRWGTNTTAADVKFIAKNTADAEPTVVADLLETQGSRFGNNSDGGVDALLSGTAITMTAKDQFGIRLSNLGGLSEPVIFRGWQGNESFGVEYGGGSVVAAGAAGGVLTPDPVPSQQVLALTVTDSTPGTPLTVTKTFYVGSNSTTISSGAQTVPITLLANAQIEVTPEGGAMTAYPATAAVRSDDMHNHTAYLQQTLSNEMVAKYFVTPAHHLDGQPVVQVAIDRIPDVLTSTPTVFKGTIRLVVPGLNMDVVETIGAGRAFRRGQRCYFESRAWPLGPDSKRLMYIADGTFPKFGNRIGLNPRWYGNYAEATPVAAAPGRLTSANFIRDEPRSGLRPDIGPMTGWSAKAVRTGDWTDAVKVTWDHFNRPIHWFSPTDKRRMIMPDSNFGKTVWTQNGYNLYGQANVGYAVAGETDNVVDPDVSHQPSAEYPVYMMGTDSNGRRGNPVLLQSLQCRCLNNIMTCWQTLRGPNFLEVQNADGRSHAWSGINAFADVVRATSDDVVDWLMPKSELQRLYNAQLAKFDRNMALPQIALTGIANMDEATEITSTVPAMPWAGLSSWTLSGKLVTANTSIPNYLVVALLRAYERFGDIANLNRAKIMVERFIAARWNASPKWAGGRYFAPTKTNPIGDNGWAAILTANGYPASTWAESWYQFIRPVDPAGATGHPWEFGGGPYLAPLLDYMFARWTKKHLDTAGIASATVSDFVSNMDAKLTADLATGSTAPGTQPYDYSEQFSIAESALSPRSWS